MICGVTMARTPREVNCMSVAWPILPVAGQEYSRFLSARLLSSTWCVIKKEIDFQWFWDEEAEVELKFEKCGVAWTPHFPPPMNRSMSMSIVMAASSVASRRNLIRVVYRSRWCYKKNCCSLFEAEKLIQGHWVAEIRESPYSVLINDQMVGQMPSTEWLQD
jgi:hypothetical protein